MKYKIKNKLNAHVKYAKVLFLPNEEKIIELDEAYEHENFHVEELEAKEEKKKPVRR
jgi:hypothetical protein